MVQDTTKHLCRDRPPGQAAFPATLICTHTSITRQKPIWSIKCLQREIRFLDLLLRLLLKLTLRRSTYILSNSRQRTLIFRCSLLHIIIKNTGKIIKKKVWGGFRVLIIWEQEGGGAFITEVRQYIYETRNRH